MIIKYIKLKKLFNKTIKDLKNNPKSITPYKSKDDKTSPTIPISYVGGQVEMFIEYMIKNKLLDDNYLKNYQKQETKTVDELSFEECLTLFTYIIKEDKNQRGLLYYKYKDGTFIKIIEKLNKNITKLL